MNGNTHICITKGLKVKIVLKADQLSYPSDGIKVRLEGGKVGRVKETL